MAERLPLKHYIKQIVYSTLRTAQGPKIDNLAELIIKEVEKGLLEQLLWETGNSIRQMSIITGWERITVRTKLKKYGLYIDPKKRRELLREKIARRESLEAEYRRDYMIRERGRQLAASTAEGKTDGDTEGDRSEQ